MAKETKLFLSFLEDLNIHNDFFFRNHSVCLVILVISVYIYSMNIPFNDFLLMINELDLTKSLNIPYSYLYAYYEMCSQNSVASLLF